MRVIKDMSQKLVQVDFNTKRTNAVRPEGVKAGSGVSCLFSGVTSKRPDLLTVAILHDIQARIEECAPLSDYGIRTQNYTRRQAATAAGSDMWEAEVRFFLEGHEAPTYPFLVLRADHRRHHDRPYDVTTEYSLHNGMRRNPCNTVARGDNYKVQVAPYITQRLLGALDVKNYDNGAQAYEAWTPN